MEALLKFAATLAPLVGVGSLILAVIIWRFLIPQTSIKILRAELDYRLKEIADKDKELAAFRQMRKDDLRRLEQDERDMRRIADGLTEMRAWRYGAEQYMEHLERVCEKAAVPHRRRDDFGLNGDEENG